MITLFTLVVAWSASARAQCIGGGRDVTLTPQRAHEALIKYLDGHALERISIGGGTFGDQGCVVKVGDLDAAGHFEIEIAEKAWRINVQRQSLVIDGDVAARVACDGGQTYEILSLGEDSSRTFFASFDGPRGFVQIPRAKVTAYYEPRVLRCQEE